MKNLFIKYKTVVRFVLVFLGTYLVLSILYSFYLKAEIHSNYYPDFVTNLVAKQSTSILSGLDYDIQIFKSPSEPSMIIKIDNAYSVRIVQGCNAISVIIMFLSFIIAFAENFKKTFLFILAGSVLLYCVNVLRIAILVVLLYKYPQFENILHSVIFPGIIYGMVFILWVIWVRMLKPKTVDA